MTTTERYTDEALAEMAAHDLPTLRERARLLALVPADARPTVMADAIHHNTRTNTRFLSCLDSAVQAYKRGAI
jgi:hypothetical protein